MSMAIACFSPTPSTPQLVAAGSRLLGGMKGLWPESLGAVHKVLPMSLVLTSNQIADALMKRAVRCKR